MVLNQRDYVRCEALKFNPPLAVLFLSNSQAGLALDNEINGSIQFVGRHIPSGREAEKAAPVYPKVTLTGDRESGNLEQ